MSSRSTVDQLNQQAWGLRSEETQQAIILATQAHSLAQTIIYPEGEARSLYILGHCWYLLSDYSQATSFEVLALTQYEALQDLIGQADVLNTLGNIHAGLGDYHAAFAHYLRSLTLRQQSGLRQAEAASWNNIGNVHYHLADYASALEAHQKSLQIKEQLGDRAGMAISLNNLGNVSKAQGNLDQALMMYQQAREIAQALDYKYALAGALSNLGAIHSQRGNLADALVCHRESLAIERTIGNRHGEAESLLQLGEVYLQAGSVLREAVHPSEEPGFTYLQQALVLADELAAHEISQRCCQCLASLFEQRGDFQQALRYYQRFHQLERLIFDQQLSETTRKLQVMHQVESAKQEVELQRAEAEVARLKTIELAEALAHAEQQRQRAEEANRFKSRLLSVAAHDLRNPLNAISNYAQLILLQYPDPGPLHEMLEPIHIGARRMEQMIHALLETSLIEDQQILLQKRPFNMSWLTKAVVEMNQSRADQKQQQLIFQGSNACVADVDEGRMWQVLDNLVSNAIKFSPSRKRIWISVERSDQMIRCTVQDEGPGLTPEDLRRAFGRFERLSATPTAGETTTGLGLSIVKQLVELHGGQVWAESAGRDQGSSFIIELPAATHPVPVE